MQWQLWRSLYSVPPSDQGSSIALAVVGHDVVVTDQGRRNGPLDCTMGGVEATIQQKETRSDGPR